MLLGAGGGGGGANKVRTKELQFGSRGRVRDQKFSRGVREQLD